MRMLGISPKHNHIIFASLGAKTKHEIAVSLTLDQKPPNHEEIITALRKVLNIASRNHVFHSVVSCNADWTYVEFDKREISNGLKVRGREMNAITLRDRINDLTDAAIAFQETAGISNSDIDDYAKILKSLAK